MKPLAERVNVARRFQRAVRIDLDLSDPEAVEGFICPQSSANVLKTMARHVAGGKQGAFTWTGPYGSGKSSLVVVLSAILGGKPLLRRSATSILGEETASNVCDALPPRQKGWRVLPVIGRRDRPARVLGEAIEAAGLTVGDPPQSWEEGTVLDMLKQIASQNPRACGGLIVFIDEMGKFLESAAYDGSDIYFFQLLAEVASRSKGRLIVVGILHQAFEEYAHRLTSETRDEWAKIQGRYVDLAVNTDIDEQIDLLSRAIETDRGPSEPSRLARGIAEIARSYTSQDLPHLLEECWPLHPVVACLLGPISRRRFGQNQRSTFGFLNSAEPHGFQDFLRNATDGALYSPDLLWDYLRSNLEPSIMASPDGHRWASAVDALERCQAAGGEETHIKVLKTVALVGMFRERSGLVAGRRLLSLALPECSALEIAEALEQLKSWSVVIYRKFDDSYNVFEGSDFDIEQAVRRALSSIVDVDFNRLEALAGLQPIVAKRHYHRTGALRWFDVGLAPLEVIEEAADSYAPKRGAIGAFLLAIPTRGESGDEVHRRCRRAARKGKDWHVTVGVPQGPWDISALARELLALEQVRDEASELQGDRVARKEIEARISYLQGRVEGELVKAFDSALWYRRGFRAKRRSRGELNSLASKLASDRYPDSPRIANELLNRNKPSGSAIAARNVLLRHMAQYEGEERLAIKGYPAEGGLFDSILEATWLYRETTDGWRFTVPETLLEIPSYGDPCHLAPAWRRAIEFLEDNDHRPVSVAEIYDIWRKPPFGIKDGLLPVMAVAFILSTSSHLAVYRQGLFRHRITDLDTDYLSHDAADIQIRWMDLSEASRLLLLGMADIVREMDDDQALITPTPIDVAKGLIAIYDRLPPWVTRTQQLSANARRLRQLFKRASDPNRLIFDEIPRALSAQGEGDIEGAPNGAQPRKSVLVMGRDAIYPSAEDGDAKELFDGLINNVRDGLIELQDAYGNMLLRLRETLLAELQVPNTSPSMLAELRARAVNVRQMSGDHRLEAFIVRLARFQGGQEDIESLESLATNKPSWQWVDADLDRGLVELADLAQSFNRLEAYAHVKGRPDRRHAMAVVVSRKGRPEPLHDNFDVTDMDRAGVEALASKIEQALKGSGERRRNIILAALAELSAKYIQSMSLSTRKRA